MRKLLIAVLVASAAAAALYRWPSTWRPLVHAGTPHERYLQNLERAGLAQTALALDWKQAAERALTAPQPVTLPRDATLSFPEDRAQASGFRMSLRRGRVLRVSATPTAQPAVIFIDLFRVEDGGPPRHVGHAEEGATTLEHEIRADGDYIVRVQPELLRRVAIRIREMTRPSLTFPVSGRDSTAVRSFFRDPRDAGRREHHGVDIFAPSGTPVVAAAGGIVTQVNTTGLGGKVVWVWDARRRQAHYYAHLSEQAVRAGAVVRAGDVVGYVGNTGNARTTPPHLHFGIYAAADGPIDPLPFVQGGRGPAVGQQAPARTRRNSPPATSGTGETPGS